jgi:hypothetical protein
VRQSRGEYFADANLAAGIARSGKIERQTEIDRVCDSADRNRGNSANGRFGEHREAFHFNGIGAIAQALFIGGEDDDFPGGDEARSLPRATFGGERDKFGIACDGHRLAIFHYDIGHKDVSGALTRVQSAGEACGDANIGAVGECGFGRLPRVMFAHSCEHDSHVKTFSRRIFVPRGRGGPNATKRAQSAPRSELRIHRERNNSPHFVLGLLRATALPPLMPK